METPIRVLHVLTAMDLAGTETLIMNFYRNINKEKVQFDFAVSATQECAYDREIEELGGYIFHYPRYKGTNHFAYKKWWEEFLDEHPEYHVVHGHIGSTAAIYLNIAKKKGRYTIAHSHSINSTVNIHSILYGLFSYPTRYIADYFFGCSQQALIDRFGKKIANNHNKARVLNNAIEARKYIYNADTRNSIRMEMGLPEDILVLGTVGRLTPAKNPDEIIRICYKLKNEGLDFVFLWYGTGELKKEVEETIKNKDLADRIKLCGTRKDIYNVLQAMDIFIFPSLWEGLGIACIEAQASGLPTLCSDTIPQEAKATALCEFLELNQTEQWVKRIIALADCISGEGYQRKNTLNEVIASGYDITSLAKWLEQFYIKNEQFKQGKEALWIK